MDTFVEVSTVRARPSRSMTSFGSALLVTLTFAILALALCFAGSARAVVAKVGAVTAGVQPRSVQLLTRGETPLTFSNPNGNPVLNSNKTLAIYWDPTNSYHGDWQHLIDTFFADMGAASGSFGVYAVDGQYTDDANQHALYQSTFMGAYTDTDPYPSSENCTDPKPLESPDLIGPGFTPVCLTDQQIQTELERFIAQHSLSRGMGTIFYLLTPPGVTVCLDGGGASGHCSDFIGTIAEVEADEAAKAAAEEKKEAYVEPVGFKSYHDSFCSYHSDISPTNHGSGDANTILYSVIPWVAGGLGDLHFTAADEKVPAYECQDGGWDPSSKPPEEHEEKKEHTTAEEEAISKMNKKELKAHEEAELLEGPHQQEPNQAPCPSPDGGCDTGLADVIINQIGVEQQNVVTNPLLDAWQDSKGNESTDECRNWFALVQGGNVGAKEITDSGTLYNQDLNDGEFYINTAFNLAGLTNGYPGIGCLPGIRLEPEFTAPNPVNVNEIVGFDGMESNVTLNSGTVYSASNSPKPTYETFTWNFGDGSPEVSGYAPGAPSANSPATSPCEAPWLAPCAASTFHSYQYGGIYEVTLTIKDVAGNTGSITKQIEVAGPPRPSSSEGEAGGGGSGTGSVTPGVSKASAPTPTIANPGAIVSSTPPPVLGAAVTSKSLKKALGGGLAVRYSANEQVAGTIQVLLESSVARRLGIKGPVATGLPKGSPSEIVVGTAVLVTTKAGAGTVHVKFSSRAASHLKHVRKVKLTLRVFARDASRQKPQTTTILSTITLNP